MSLPPQVQFETVESLSVKMNDMMQTVMELGGQIKYLAENIPNTPPSSSPQTQPQEETPKMDLSFSYKPLPEGKKEPKVAVPEPFDGKQENTESFINSVNLYINACPSEFPFEATKVYWTLPYMIKGCAKDWHDTFLESIKAGEVDLKNFEAFIGVLQHEFGDTGKQHRKI